VTRAITTMATTVYAIPQSSQASQPDSRGPARRDFIVKPGNGLHLTHLVEASSGNTANVAAAATSLDPLVPGSPLTVNYFGNSTLQGYIQQPAAVLIRVPDAQAVFGGGNTVVADIDTGVDANHPALLNVFVPGYDFIAQQAGIPSDFSDLDQSTVALLDQLQPASTVGFTVQPFTVSQSTVALLDQSTVALLDQSTVALLDQSTVALLDSNPLPPAFGHGTMVAGLIHLVAPGATIMPLRAFHSDGTGNLSDIVNAIYFATNNGAQVINMSFSSASDSPSLRAAIRYAWWNHVICVASAGNQGSAVTVFPASYRTATGVGSTDEANLRSMFSNYGSGASDTAAPGEALLTTFPNGNYAGVWGTSFSTALVSGAAALATSVSPGLPLWEFILGLDSGYSLGNAGLGYARLDVLSLLQKVSALSNISSN
jgi:subtilisin family serine protease